MNRFLTLLLIIICVVAALTPCHAATPGRSLIVVYSLSNNTRTIPTQGAAETGTKGKMKVLVLTGSPRRNGNSNTLADQFVKGAEESGHEVMRFDSAFRDVHHCTACNACGMNGDCVFKDDFTSMRSFLLEADLVAFVTPMYYFGMSAQLKAVIDRFYSVSSRIHDAKRAVLMMTYANSGDADAAPIRSHYEVLLRYLGWTDAGRIIAPGVWPAGAINRTPYPEQAYQLGKSI